MTNIPVRRLKGIVILIGFSSVFSQSLLIRELLVVFYGNEIVVGVILAFWMLWTGLGSLWAERAISKKSLSVNLFYSVYLLFSFSILLELFLIRNIRVAFNFEPGEIISLFNMFSISAFVLLPFAFLNGFLFFLCVRVFQNVLADSGIGLVYALDSVGDMLGGIAFSFLFVFLLSPLENLYIVFLANVAVIMYVLSTETKSLIRRVSYIFLIFLLISCIFIVPSLEDYLVKREWKGFNVVDMKSSLYGNLYLTKYKDTYTLYENGLLGFSFPFRMDCEESVHFTFLESQRVERVLIIGEGLKGLLYEVLKYPVKEVYYLELDPLLVSFVKNYLPSTDKKALSDKRVKVINLEARTFLNHYRGEKFNVIMLNSPPPYTAYLNRFYTYEFFTRIREILQADGVFSFTLPSKEDYLTKEMRVFNASIYKTLRRVFPYVLLIPGSKLRMIAALENFLTYNDNVLAQRLKDYRVKTQFVNRYYFKARFLPWHINYVYTTLEDVKSVRFNYDFKPIGYYYGMMFFVSYFRSSTNIFLRFLTHIKPWVYFLFVFIVLVFLAKKTSSVLSLSMFSMGAAGMGVVILSILGFQIVYGYVYHKIGLITAMFMLGSAWGAYWSNKKTEYLSEKHLALLMLFGGGVISLLPYIFRHLVKAPPAAEGLVYILPVFMGLIVGFSFPLVNKLYNKIRDKSGLSRAGFFYFLDLLGGAVAGVVLSFIFIPLYGLYVGGLVLGFMLFICSILLGLSRLR